MLLVDILQDFPLPKLFAATLGCGVVVGAVVLISVRLAAARVGGRSRAGPSDSGIADHGVDHYVRPHGSVLCCRDMER